MNWGQRNWIFGWAVWGAACFADAAELSPESALESARKWMAGNPIMAEAAGRCVDSVESFSAADGVPVYVVQFNPTGYLVLNSDDRLPLVVSFSVDTGVNLSDDPQNAFRKMLLQYVTELELEGLETNAPLSRMSVETLAADELYGPFLETSWSQCNPYNQRMPEVNNALEGYSGRAPVGCVPTAFAQLMMYHRWPVHGTGSYSYTDTDGNTVGAHSATFSDAYDWGAMRPSYDVWGSNSAPAEAAVSELMYELGVAADADYETEGTSSSDYGFGSRLPEYFYFEPREWRSTQAQLVTPLEADLRAGFPCVVSVPGHSVVADGLMVDSGATYYHINYGWGGENNGWYTVDDVVGDALQSGSTSLRPQLLAFPQTNAVAVAEGAESVELQWILPKRRESEVQQLEIFRFDDQSQDWESLQVDTNLNSRRFSATETVWEECADFSGFVETSTYSQRDWSISTTSGVENCFFKPAGGYGNVEYHLTSLSTLTPTDATRLLLHTQYDLAYDQFRVSVSLNRTTFEEIWAVSGSVDWSDVAIDLSAYAGQALYLRLEYVPDSYYPGGGIWIDSVSLQETVHPELEGQPIYYTSLTNLPAGTHTLAARLTDTLGVEHALAPSFTLTVPCVVDDGDGMPSAWETQYGLNPELDDGALDADGDLLSNYEEYLAGTDPTNAVSRWVLQSGAEGMPTFYGAPSRAYAVEFSTNLVTGPWISLTNLVGSDSLIELQNYDAPTNSVRFYRVGVQIQE